MQEPPAGRDFKSFRREDIRSYCADDANLAHYAAAQIGPSLADRFIRENMEMGLLKADGENIVTLAVDGKSLKTVLANYKRDYREQSIKRHARRSSEELAFHEYKKTYRALTDFP